MAPKTKIKNKPKKRKPAARRNPPGKVTLALFWLRRFGVALAGVLFALWLGAWIVLSDTPQKMVTAAQEKFVQDMAAFGFTAQKILVEGRDNVDPNLLFAVLNIAEGDPLFAFHPAAAREQIEKIVWVKSVQVQRRLPDTIYVGLEERKPLALWNNKGRIYILDRAGEVITRREGKMFSDMITVLGPEDAAKKTPGFLALLLSEPLLYESTSKMERIEGRRWDLVLKNGVRVKLPEDDPGFAMRRVVAAQEKDQIWARDIMALDMRRTDRIVIRTRPGGVQDYQESLHSAKDGGAR